MSTNHYQSAPGSINQHISLRAPPKKPRKVWSLTKPPLRPSDPPDVMPFFTRLDHKKSSLVFTTLEDPPSPPVWQKTKLFRTFPGAFPLSIVIHCFSFPSNFIHFHPLLSNFISISISNINSITRIISISISKTDAIALLCFGAQCFGKFQIHLENDKTICEGILLFHHRIHCHSL